MVLTDLRHDILVGRFVQLKELFEESAFDIRLQRGREGKIESIDAADGTAIVSVRVPGRVQIAYMYVRVPLQKLRAA